VQQTELSAQEKVRQDGLFTVNLLKYDLSNVILDVLCYQWLLCGHKRAFCVAYLHEKALKRPSFVHVTALMLFYPVTDTLCSLSHLIVHHHTLIFRGFFFSFVLFLCKIFHFFSPFPAWFTSVHSTDSESSRWELYGQILSGGFSPFYPFNLI